MINILTDEINKWGQYPSSVAIETGPSRAQVIDFVLDTKDGSIPIEVKVYPKRIISNNFPYKLRDKMRCIMKLVNANSSILIMLNPEITKRAKAIIQETNKKTKIIIIQDSEIEGLRKQFRNCLKKLKPL